MTTETLTRLIISGIFIIAYVAILSVWLMMPHQASMDDKVTTALISILTAGVLQIVNYWFGGKAN